MNSEEYKGQIYKRIEKTEELLNQVIDKNSFVFVAGLDTLKCDYENVDEKEKADEIAKEIIGKIQNNLVATNGVKEKRKLEEILVSAFDTRARCGDFESFCIAMEWNRPIEKQFFIPRMKLLKKHGVVQCLQDLYEDRLDLAVLNMPP